MTMRKIKRSTLSRTWDTGPAGLLVLACVPRCDGRWDRWRPTFPDPKLSRP
jgi:hypothetical protein